MFKLESYITPLLMGYLDKYVQLRQEDFQLSLWGGDAVLNNLDLRLNELEKVIQLPVMFQSGHIHELRLHVPWTKLGSEPVVITINTVECIVKVRDTAYEATQANNSPNSPRKTVQQRVKIKRRPQPTEELPPGYLQSIVNRIINNVTFIINNLILKFVEDDIVLSVNIKSAECYSVDKEWNRAFADLTPDNLALRKVLNFADLTVCLDKTNASGHIESYQEPVAYRCAMTCRLYMEYESHLAKFPRVTRFNLYCDTLNLSLTDTQLPMLVRLIQLCIAMYYGTLDIPSSPPVTLAAEETPQYSTDVDTGIELDTKVEVDQSLDQGWVSWAWSYVPQILPSEEEEADLEKQLMEQGRRGKPAPHILSLGFYFHQGVILFKLTEKSREGSELPHKKIHFHPFLKLSGEGLGIEVLLQGLTFCDIQCGFTAFKLSTCGSCICGVPDEKVERCNILLSGGEQLASKAGQTYITHSLFDDTSWENMGRRSQHIVDAEQHRQVFTEQHALQRFGAFWVDSLYTFEKPEKHGASSNSSETDSSEPTFQKEFSTLRFVLGNTHLNVSSTLYHRLGKLIACAQSHQYQPYGSTTAGSSVPGEDRPKPTEEQVQSLEEFIPTVLLHVMAINPTVMILSAEHPHCDVAQKSYRIQHKKRDSKTTEEPHHPSPLPALVLSVSRFDLQITKPMYPQRLVRLVTAIAGPSSNLLHHCHSHMQIKLFSFQVGIQRVAWDRKTSRVLTLVPPCSFALYSRSMVLPKLWTNSSLPQQEWMYEIPSISLNVNKASVYLCCRLLSSWLAVSKKQEAEFILDDSLLDDLFPVSGESSHQTYPLLEIGLYGLEFKSCESSLVNACVASLSSLHVFLYTPGVGGKMSAIPILYGPSDTSNVNCSDFFIGPTLIKSEVRSDFITATFQKPKQTQVSEAQALALVDCQGACVWLDPGLISWFHYCPQPRPARKQEHPPVSLDLSLAHMTSPLNIMSNASLHSTSSPSHPGRQTASLTKPPLLDRPTSIPEETSDPPRSGGAEDSFGKLLASYFPLIRMLHVQVELKPAAIFLPKTSIPNSESSSDILALVHQALLAGRLSDTLVVCVPSIMVVSSMAKPMSVVQELPVTSIQGSLIGEKLPWTVKVNNLCAYSLQSGKHDAVFLLHPLDILSTIAVNCKYNPPTSENISTLAVCLHVDVGSPQLEISATQLLLCSTMVALVSSLVSNVNKLAEDCGKLFLLSTEDKTLLATLAPTSLKISASSTCKIESIRSAEVTENITADISEDFSREASPLHESLIDDSEEAGVKLSVWVQLLIPKLTITMYATCPVTDQENSLALNLEHFDLTVDSQNVYSKVKMTLGLVKILHMIKQRSGSWFLSPAEGVVVSFMKQLPHKMVVVTNKIWGTSQGTPVFHQDSQETPSKDKKSVVSITFTRALCKNVKRRLRKANVELPSVGDPDFSTTVEENDLMGSQQFEQVDIYFHKYLSEVCVKMETLDIVLKPELVAVVNSVIAGVSKSSRAGKNPATDLKSDITKFMHFKDERSAGVVNLPLLYADIGTIRIFVPQTQTLSAGNDHQVPDEMGHKENTPLIPPEGLKSPARSSVQSAAVSNDAGSLSQHAAAITTQPAHHVSSVGFQTPGSAVLPDTSITVTSTVASPVTSQNVGQSFTDSPKSVSPELEPGKEVCSTIYHDMVVLQVSGCMLQPHAENPLPRNAQEKEVFNYAVQSGFTQQPGAVLEDRQYQFDIKGVSLATGVWDHILKEMKRGSHRKDPQGSQVQIPALDWNTFLMDSLTQEVKEIRLIPIVAPFDLSIVVAPPIAYQPKEGSYVDSVHSRLICGLASELNLTSDLDLYVNPRQVKLLTDIVCQISQYSSSEPHKTGLHILPASPLPTVIHNGKWRSQQPSEFTTGADSGVESDLSTLTLDLGHRQVPYRQTLQLTTAPSNMSKRPEKADEGRLTDTSGQGPPDLLFPFMAPVDILVTAGRISCTVYSYKVLEENLVLELLNFRDRIPAHERSGAGTSTGGGDGPTDHNGNGTTARDNLEHLLNHSRQSRVVGSDPAEEVDDYQASYLIPEDVQVLDEGLKKIIPRGSVCLVPFLYVYIAQPHCLMSSHLRESTKMEVSCYDVMVKAAADQHVIAVDDHHLLPESADFSSHWLETRAGCPHPFTGIPPALLTARFLREYSKPDTLSIKVERPVRLKVSQLAVEQAISFWSELKVVFPRNLLGTTPDMPGLENKNSDNKNMESSMKISSLVDRLDITTSQIVVDLSFTDSHVSPGIVLSVETTIFQVDKEPNSSIVPYLHIEDIMIKTSYEKQLRQFIGPFSVKTDGLISWISLPNDLFLPQILLDVEVGYLPITFCQEHMFCLNELSQKMSAMIQRLTEDARSSQATGVPATDRNISGQVISSCAFILDRSHDDLRSGGFQFIEQTDGLSLHPDVGQIHFQEVDPQTGENSSMSWHYPTPRVITHINLTPVPFSLSAALNSGAAMVQCVLQYWDELRGSFVDLVEFHLSENETVSVSMPEPKASNTSRLVAASVWRVVLVQPSQNSEIGAAVLPPSLAACMCVDSACIPSLIPSVQLSVGVSAAEIQLCHHLKYNGSDLPVKLRQYKICPEQCQEQIFAVVRVDDLTSVLSHVAGTESKTCVKLSLETSLDVLEYGHLKMEPVLSALKMQGYVDITGSQKTELTGNMQVDELRLRVGKGCVHTLNTAATAWSTFNPRGVGPYLMFSYYIVCNNTTSTIRFGQAGTDEKLILNSMEMLAYRWRTYNASQMLHLCLDKPSWRWTEPFVIDKEGSTIRSVSARDQNYLVIVKVKQVANMLLQVTISGQLVISNRLSQPISMKTSHSSLSNGKDKKETGQQYIIQSGTFLPSLVSSEVLLNPVQFRLARCTTSWSHDIFLSGDRMKDSQLVKIPLPDGSSYFHIWCRVFCQHFQGLPQKMGVSKTATVKLVMLTPLYVVRTHLPHPLYIHLDSPKAKKSQEIMARSQGQEFQLHCTGGDVTHQLSFRLCSGMMLSSPAVVLSTGLIDQLPRNPVGSVDIEQICEQKMDLGQKQWPYLSDDAIINQEMESGTTAVSQVLVSEQKNCDLSGNPEQEQISSKETQPSITLNIRLTEYLAGCDTLLVEVTPPYLVHNATDMEVNISGAEGTSWCIQPSETMAPPLLKNEFKLAIKYHNVTSRWKSIPVSEESVDYRRYNEDIGTVLFIDGYVHVSFLFNLSEGDKSEGSRSEVVFLTITSGDHNGIRVICIRERFALTNNTGNNLALKLLTLPLSLQQVKMAELEGALVCSSLDQPRTGSRQGQRPRQGVPLPLFRWSTVSSSYQPEDQDNIPEKDYVYVSYISFAASSDLPAHLNSPSRKWRWSLPVRVVSSRDGYRTTTSIPDFVVTQRDAGEADDPAEWTPVSHAVCVVTQIHQGITHIVVNTDEAPACIVENLCEFSLEFGQTCDTLTSTDAVVQEQVELVSDVPWVPAGGWCHYTPPAVNSEFITKETINIPRLHFRAADVSSEEFPSGFSAWSSGVQISGNLDAFVRLPNFCDLKILIQSVGMVTHLIVRPVSKAEITAKEIRSRITNSGEVKITSSNIERKSDKTKFEPGVSSSPDTKVMTASSEVSVSVNRDSSVAESASVKFSKSQKHAPVYSQFSEKQRLKKNHKTVSLTLGVLCSSCIVSLLDESNGETVSDLMSVHSRDLFLACYPVFRGPDHLGLENSFAFSMGELQIDNQQYGVGAFDFPVVLLPQKTNETATLLLSSQSSSSLSVLELHAILKSKAFIHIQVVTVSDQIWQQFVIETLDVTIKPLSLYIDDTFIYRLLEELESFNPSRLSQTVGMAVQSYGVLNRKLPAVVKLNSYTLSYPIRIKHVVVQPMKILLSVHASMKLFLASDHTPLSMSKFERVNVYSTQQRMTHAFTVHYASAAVFRAGIVVGSLEILGNPTGLVRSIGTGVSDFISLPYSGLSRGPGAFITGLSRGFGSLVKNVSAGMITSVTNFASSVSRNMDRLSLDSSHLERQEENRRNRPLGVSDGLKQGLTGFGISLLGAVAGLADQPIQTLLASGSQDKPRSSASSRASGLMTGVGKGLVGVITKPIGGAAEFVSQTGQGILHGAGLAHRLVRLEKPSLRCRQELANSQYKHAVKIFSSLPNHDLLLMVPAVTYDLIGSEVRVELLLTSDVLVVMNVEEDAQQQTFTLAELECLGDGEDGKVILQWLDRLYSTSSQELAQSSNKERVAAFIDTQTPPGQTMELSSMPDRSRSPSMDHVETQVPGALPREAGLEDVCVLEISASQRELPSSMPQYEFQMKPHLKLLFLAVFKMAKQKRQGRGFPMC